MKRIDGLIWKYFLKGKKGKEANRLERIALNDPFLYEALEGMEGIEGDHKQIVAQLQQKIKLPRSRHHIFYRVAAAIVLLGGIAAGLLYNPDEPMPLSGVEKELDSVRSDNAGVMAAVTLQEIQSDTDKVKAQVILGDVSQTNLETVDCQKRKRVALNGIMPECAEQKIRAVREEQKDTVPVPVQGKRISVETRRQENRDSVVLQGLRITGWSATAQKQKVNKRRQKHMELSGQQGKIKNTWRNDFRQYVDDSLRYPPAEQKNKVEGEVVLSVHLNKHNRPSRIKVVRKLSPACDREARRLVVEYPGIWNTGVRDFTVTVRFSLKTD